MFFEKGGNLCLNLLKGFWNAFLFKNLKMGMNLIISHHFPPCPWLSNWKAQFYSYLPFLINNTKICTYVLFEACVCITWIPFVWILLAKAINNFNIGLQYVVCKKLTSLSWVSEKPVWSLDNNNDKDLKQIQVLHLQMIWWICFPFEGICFSETCSSLSSLKAETVICRWSEWECGMCT